jgi:hypothetical protein
MMCMFDDLAYVDDFPGYDHQGDDYVVEFDDDCLRETNTIFMGRRSPIITMPR